MKVKGFTLIEIVVVLVIIGILAAIALPNYSNSVNQGYAQNAQNNLLAIYHAQNTYYLNTGNYCGQWGSSAQVPAGFVSGCTSLAAINNTLSLNLSDTYFTSYSCAVATGQNGYGQSTTLRAESFRCAAYQVGGNPNFELMIFSAPLGGWSYNGAWTNNPYCSTPRGTSYCPST